MASRTPFRLMNRTVNRLLKPLLRSPLHPIASDRVALLTYTGRKTGKEYTIPVFYRDKGDRITVAVGWPDRKAWWRNLTGDGAPVELLVRGERLRGHAVATREGDQDAIVRIDLDEPRSR
ncbi:MAG: nitroreductase/quinone reductase family protein [Nitriliruptorales bacterium]|nr:nitroreductase/quinone reductase family protein [Nitriliruptorales bacterium]